MKLKRMLCVFVAVVMVIALAGCTMPEKSAAGSSAASGQPAACSQRQRTCCKIRYRNWLEPE